MGAWESPARSDFCVHERLDFCKIVWVVDKNTNHWVLVHFILYQILHGEPSPIAVLILVQVRLVGLLYRGAC